MASDFKDSLQGGKITEKELYDTFIDYLADKHEINLE